MLFRSIIHQEVQSIVPPKYWGLSTTHENDISDMVHDYYKPIEQFYGNNKITNVLREIMTKTKGIYLLSKFTPVPSNIKMDKKELFNTFDNKISILLYEYYFLSVLSDYIYLTKDPSMISRMLVVPDREQSDVFAADFLIEQQLRFTEEEQEFIDGNVMELNKDISKLLNVFLNIMMRSKNTINVSYNDVEDKVFKLKEAEKYDFTDKLKDMTDEARAVDTILKHHKLGPLYSLGLSKGIKEYDTEHFEHDKQIAENVANIQKKLRRIGNDVEDMDIDEAINEINTQREIDIDTNLNMNQSDDYNDGDPWGDELNDDDY